MADWNPTTKHQQNVGNSPSAIGTLDSPSEYNHISRLIRIIAHIKLWLNFLVALISERPILELVYLCEN